MHHWRGPVKDTTRSVRWVSIRCSEDACAGEGKAQEMLLQQKASFHSLWSGKWTAPDPFRHSLEHLPPVFCLAQDVDGWETLFKVDAEIEVFYVYAFAAVKFFNKRNVLEYYVRQMSSDTWYSEFSYWVRSPTLSIQARVILILRRLNYSVTARYYNTL